MNPRSVTSLHRGALHRQFEAFADSRPEATALLFEDLRLSYAELEEAANRVANALREKELPADALLALRLPAGPEQIIAILAAWKAGFAYVPLDSSPEREDKIIAVAAPALIIDLQVFEALQSDQTGRPQADGDELTRLAYVMFTSGSTGTPKGVKVSHANISNLYALPELPLSSQDIWTQSHSFAFGFSVWEMWGALATGAALLIVPPESRRDPRRMQELMQEAGCTVCSITPSGLAQWLALDEVLPADTLRLLVLSGEAAQPARIAEWYERGSSKARVINTYALTETSGRVCLQEFAPGKMPAASIIGKPCADFEVRIDDNDELLIIGDGVAEGYLNDEALTAQHFFELDGKPAYRSGDRVRQLEDGSLEYLGRVDHQIKVRGYRVEPAEVERSILDCPGVREVYVDTAAVEGGEPQLTAWYVREAGAVAEGEPEFWPSLGEYQIYDELLYEFMNADEIRVAAYRQAFESAARGKVVLDIGTGQDALLARLSVAAGARKAYAVEVIPEAAAKAQRLVERLGLTDRITVICGDMQSPEVLQAIDEPPEVITQGIIGNIGSSDGIIPIWNSAAPLFANDYRAVPSRCVTRIAPVELPATLRTPQMSALAAGYTEKVFADANARFDIRLCVRNFPEQARLAEPALFEDIDFQQSIAADDSGTLSLTVTHSGCFDGLLLWTEVETLPGQEVDFLDNQQAWLPVYLPVLDEGRHLSAGDVLQIKWERCTGADGVFPDYRLQVALDGEQLADYTTRHHETELGRNGFYRDLHEFLETQVAAGEEQLRAWAAERLPDYMQPSAWVSLPAMPLSANGKLDRSALPAPGTASADYREPESELQKQVAQLWADVLGRERVGLGENFFDIGGDSILAVRLTTEVQRWLDDTVFLAAVFNAPDVASFAAYLEEHHADAVARVAATEAEHGEAKLAAVEPEVSGSDAEVPLSFAQQSLWFLDRLYPGSTAANEQFAIRLNGPVDDVRLQSAWQELVRRHDILRTRFRPDADSAVQVVGNEVPPLQMTGGSLQDIAAREIAQNFDLQNGPLLSASWLTDESVLLVTVHHILADGLSVEIVRDELAQLYAGESLPDVAMQFGDFALQERGVDGQAEADSVALSFWQDNLEDADSLLNFPQSATHNIESVAELSQHFTIPADEADRLRALAKEQGVSLFVLMLALYRITLSRFTGQRDLLIGSPVTLRQSEELSRMIGCMVNNLPFRNVLKSEASLGEVIQAEQQAAVQVIGHAGVPLEAIVETIDPPREFGRHPLFQALLMFEDRSADDAFAGDVRFSIEVPHIPRPSYWDIETSVTDAGAGRAIDIVIGLQPARYDAALTMRFADGFAALLSEALRDVDQQITEVPLQAGRKAAAELARLSVGHQESYARGLTLPAMFTHQVALTPDAAALHTANGAVSYCELGKQANSIANGLQESGVKPGARVGVCLPRSSDRVAAVIGVLKAGAIVVPLDPRWPAERVSYMQSVAEPSVVIDEELLPQLLNAGSSEPGVEVYPDHPAWVLFTSGSTGEPKGVLYSHRSAVHRISWMWDAPETGVEFSEDDRFVHRTSLNFVDAWWELFGPLAHGASVVIPEPEADADPHLLLQTLQQYQVTHMVAVPSLLAVLLADESAQQLSLTSLITSGETLGADLYRQVREAWPGSVVLNTYGTTETWDITCHVCDDAVSETLPVGRPLPCVEAWVLDQSGQPVPPGVWGELVVGGIGLPLGYLGSGGESPATDPFIKLNLHGDEQRYYRSGDVARYRNDGALELGGRLDRQLKIRGLRVNPAEIEFNLRNCEGVQQAAIHAVADPQGQAQLVGYVVGLHQLNGADLQAYLRAWLPDVLIPRDYIQMDALPLTPSGKVDYLRLPEPDWSAAATIQYAEPVTATEKVLAGIWEDVLGAEQVGRDDDFFALRGHSLMAARLMSRVCDVLEADLPLQVLFEHPTLRGLAHSIDTLRWAAGDDEAGTTGDEREELRF